MVGTPIVLLLLIFIPLCDGLIPRKCLKTPGAENDQWLRKEKCYYCSRMYVIYMDSLTEWKIIHEEAGCADEVDMEETPPGMDCATHLGSNSSGRGSNFVMYFTTRGGTELVAKRCCENFDGECNGPFEVNFPMKYLLRHIKRSPPRIFAIVIVVSVLIFYYLLRIYLASRSNQQMSLDVTKKEQMKMFGYRDDPLEQAIIDNRSKVEEPDHAVRKASAFPSFNDAVRAITDIQWIQNKKKFDGMWTAALPKMRKEAAILGLQKPLEQAPSRILPVPEKQRAPFYELRKSAHYPRIIFTDILKHQTMSSKILKTQNRPVPSGLPDLVLKLIEHGPYEYPFKPAELFHVFEKAKDVFGQDSSVLLLKNSHIVIGDIRGRYVDLFRYFNAFGWPPQRSYLFLGGIIENEEDQSVECMALLSSLKTAMPDHIHILRGVGETIPYVPGRRFPGVKGEVIGNALARLCNSLPLAAVINQKILCTHSGVTTHFKGKSKLNNLQRPFTIEDMTEAGRRIIFAVPETNCRMFRMRPHEKNGEVFGAKAVQKTLSNMKLELLIRSRSPINDGYVLHWDNHVLSIWSALTHGITKAAAVEIDPSCRITLHLLDTTARLTLDKKLRVTTNNAKVKEEEEEESEEEEIVDDPERGSDSGKKDKGGDEQKSKSAKPVLSTDDPEMQEKTASGKSGDKPKDGGGASREKTTMKDTKDSKEPIKEQATMMVEPEREEGIHKTQDSMSARATELPFTESMMEQKTQSVKEWKEGAKGAHEDSKKKGKKKEEEGGKKDEGGKKKEEEKEKEKIVLKTPDISIKSHVSVMHAATPAKEAGISGKKKKKVEEKEMEDAVPKSKYDDAIPLKVKKEELKKKDKEAESVMRDVSVRRKEVADKDLKSPMDSLREGMKGEDKTKKKSNETMNEGGSKEPMKEDKENDNAISEKSMGSKTHKTAKKGKKEEKKEKEEHGEKKEKEEKEGKKEKHEEKEEKKKEDK